jgi:hypothetical protein
MRNARVRAGRTAELQQRKRRGKTGAGPFQFLSHFAAALFAQIAFMAKSPPNRTASRLAL